MYLGSEPVRTCSKRLLDLLQVMPLVESTEFEPVIPDLKGKYLQDKKDKN